MTQHLLEQAIRWQAAGIVALPVRSDGSKAPGTDAMANSPFAGV